MHQCRKVNLGSLDCYGVTRHPDTKQYLMVIRFVELADLRNYLSKFATNNWKDLLDRLWSLTIDLRSLHRSGLVHRDLHSGNVLFGDNRRNFVADLGFDYLDNGANERTRGVVLAAVSSGVAHVLDLGFVEVGQFVLLGL